MEKPRLVKSALLPDCVITHVRHGITEYAIVDAHQFEPHQVCDRRYVIGIDSYNPNVDIFWYILRYFYNFCIFDRAWCEGITARPPRVTIHTYRDTNKVNSRRACRRIIEWLRAPRRITYITIPTISTATYVQCINTKIYRFTIERGAQWYEPWQQTIWPPNMDPASLERNPRIYAGTQRYFHMLMRSLVSQSIADIILTFLISKP
jgi:hypothetical protein